MAVMSSQPPDSSAPELKTPPVPPSDKMALDADINGAAKQNVTTTALASTEPSKPVTDSAHPSPPKDAPSNTANGFQKNLVSFGENQSLSAATSSNEPAPSAAAPSNLASGETTATPVPPVVEAPTSDVRQEEAKVASSENPEKTPERQPAQTFQGVSEEKLDEKAPEQGTTQPQDHQMEDVADAISAKADAPIAHEAGKEDKMDIFSDINAPTASTSTATDGGAAEPPRHPAPAPAPQGAAPETPREPAPTPAAAPPTMLKPDPEPTNAPPSPGKNAREREDDEAEEPAHKRTRTEQDGTVEPEFKVPEQPASATSADTGISHVPSPPAAPAEASQPITPAQHKFLLHGIRNIKRTKDAFAFNAPVDPIKLNIPSYLDFIKKPMDLGTMEDKLKRGAYSSIDEYVSDFHQIVENTTIFNGAEHPVTKAAVNMKGTFDKQMSNLPRADVTEPTPAEKKAAKKASVSKASAARRESRAVSGAAARPSTAAAPAPTTPPAAAGSQTFALGPQGVPLIRRDSMASGDGRPKREIHPPPPRDLPYSSVKPKKKKYQLELRFCQEVVNEMNKPKYQMFAFPFYQPVDPVALNIPHYHKIIKKPMDLGTVSSKLKGGQYENAKEFESDVRLMFANCFKFNPPMDQVHQMGRQLEEVFNRKWDQKKEWIEDHTPASGPHSPGTSPEPEEEEEEEEEEMEEEEENEISILQKQIAAMSKQVEMIKKKSSPPAPTKKGVKSAKPAKKVGKKSATTVTLPAKVEKKAKPKVKKERIPYVTYEEKQEISNRINTLPESKMATALKIIRDNMPNLRGVDDEELELDIDELSNEVLYKLLTFVRKYAPGQDAPEEVSAPARPRSDQPRSSSSSKPKKNKPMSKYEQEARISELQGRLKGFQHPGSDGSPEPTREDDESSGDDSESGSESEEE